MSISNKHIYIWDSPREIPSSLDGKEILLWKKYSEKKEIDSILELAERWADILKIQYLEWIYELGNKKINKKSIVEFLKIRKDFSCWWFGLIVEKSNFSKSPYINEIIKFLALNKWLKDKNINQITIYSVDSNLIKSIKSFCFKRGIKFKSKKIIFPKKFKSKKIFQFKFRTLIKYLPYEIKSTFWLFYKVFNNLPLKNIGLKNFNFKDQKHIFISYLFNMKNSDQNKFKFSSYWGNLPDKLIEKEIKSLWIHIYVKDEFLNNSFKAANLIKKLNKDNKFQKHLTLYSFMCFKVLYKVIKDWFNLYFKLRRVNIKKNFPCLQDFDVWNYYRNDWFDSFIGSSAIDNLLKLNLFEEAFCDFSENYSFYYLLENQGWEMAMLSVVSNLDNLNVIGFSHASVRFWDLRNFYDKREYQRRDKLKIPMPKILAVNSQYAFDLLYESGYPKSQLRIVEALRHLYLKKILDNKTKMVVNRSKQKIKGKTSILVLSDYLLENTKFQLGLLNNLSLELINSLEIIVKPHPACKIKKNWFPNLNMKVVNDPISSLLSKTNITYCSGLTSASIDAYSCGNKVIISSNPQNLNLSPLRGFKDVSFVRNSFELKNIIIKLSLEYSNNVSQRCIFEISTDLQNWEELL